MFQQPSAYRFRTAARKPLGGKVAPTIAWEQICPTIETRVNPNRTGGEADAFPLMFFLERCT